MFRCSLESDWDFISEFTRESPGSQLYSSPKSQEMVSHQCVYFRGLLLISCPSDLSFIPFSLPNGGGGDSWVYGSRGGRQ